MLRGRTHLSKSKLDIIIEVKPLLFQLGYSPGAELELSSSLSVPPTRHPVVTEDAVKLTGCASKTLGHK